MHKRHMNSQCLHLNSLGLGPASPVPSCLNPGFANLGMAGWTNAHKESYFVGHGVTVHYNCRVEEAAAASAGKVYYLGRIFACGVPRESGKNAGIPFVLVPESREVATTS